MTATRSSLLVVLSFLLLPSLSCEQAPTDRTEENKQAVRDLYGAIDAQDYDRVREIFPENALAYVIGTDEGFPRDTGIEMMQMFYASFPGYTHVIDRIVAEGDWVAVQLTFHAKHQQEFQGIPATGNAVTYGGAHFGRIVDGKIMEWWILENDLSLMQQLGMDLAPAATEGAEG